MNKRKILSLALGLCMVAILAVGGTLAYFVDTDAASNVFTTGNVSIDLIETFTQNSKLIPTTGKDEDGEIINAVDKIVNVKNIGSEPAYVRVHIAIPSLLDNGDPSFDAGKNVLHFNYAPESIGDGLWDWSKTTGEVYEGDWNYYEETIDGTDYNVYVVTYGAVLAAGQTTAADAMHQVYLDAKVTNDDIQKLNAALGTTWQIKVAAEGAQSEGFDDAYAALNAAFGVPGEYDVNWVTTKP